MCRPNNVTYLDPSGGWLRLPAHKMQALSRRPVFKLPMELAPDLRVLGSQDMHEAPGRAHERHKR